jgi:hypothetical protein
LEEESDANRANRYELGQQSRSYWGALGAVQSFKTFKRFGETTPLYEKDTKYKALVDEYFGITQELFAPRIYAVEAAPGGAYSENYQFWDVTLSYVESSGDLQNALPVDERKIIAGVLGELQQQIFSIQQQEPPSVQILEGLIEAGTDLVTAPLHLHEVPGALYELATNPDARAAVAQQVKNTINEIGEGNWKTITKVVVNIPVAVSGVGAAANAAGKVKTLTITLSKAAAQRIAKGGLKAKDLLKELLAASREERAANAPKGINGTVDRSYAQTPQQKLGELAGSGDDAANILDRSKSYNSMEKGYADGYDAIFNKNNGTWTRPPGWRLPKNGTWEGTPGHSNFIPSNPAALGLKPGEVVPFTNGRPDFSKWTFDLDGKLAPNTLFTAKETLTGVHPVDQPKMVKALAAQKGWTVTKTEEWLTANEYVLHHAGGNTFQLLDGRLHGATAWGYNGIRHMGGAYELRNK